MGRPYSPGVGTNRQILLLLRRSPGTWPGSVARLLGLDSGVVRESIARLCAHGDAVAEEGADGHRHLYVTEQGLAALRRRKATPRRRAAA